MGIDSDTARTALGNTGRCRCYKLIMLHLRVSEPAHSLLWPSIQASAPGLDLHSVALALRALALPALALQVNMEEATVTLRLE